jgi:hypothetical protein
MHSDRSSDLGSIVYTEGGGGGGAAGSAGAFAQPGKLHSEVPEYRDGSSIEKDCASDGSGGGGAAGSAGSFVSPPFVDPEGEMGGGGGGGAAGSAGGFNLSYSGQPERREPEDACCADGGGGGGAAGSAGAFVPPLSAETEFGTGGGGGAAGSCGAFHPDPPSPHQTPTNCSDLLHAAPSEPK